MHAQEPWQVGMDPMPAIYAGPIHVAEHLHLYDAKRIVACVNCLAGIPANDLPRVRKVWNQFLKLECLAGIPPQHGSMPPVSSDLDDKVTRATEQP